MKRKQLIYKQSSCDGKAKLDYKTAQIAQKRSPHGNVAYKCKSCGYWHTGSTIGSPDDYRKKDRKNSSRKDLHNDVI